MTTLVTEIEERRGAAKEGRLLAAAEGGFAVEVRLLTVLAEGWRLVRGDKSVNATELDRVSFPGRGGAKPANATELERDFLRS
jgi:hypothetical protein